MTTVTVSQRYQIVIPKEVRQSLGITPGQKIEVIVNEGRAEFVPVRDMGEMRGFPYRHKATLWTQARDFEGLEGVMYLRK